MKNKLLAETEINNRLNNLAIQVKYDLMKSKKMNNFFCENMFYLYDNKELINNLNNISKTENIKNAFFVKEKRIGVVGIDITLIKELSNSLNEDKIKDLLLLTFKEAYLNQNDIIRLKEYQAFDLFTKSNLDAKNYLFGMQSSDNLEYSSSERKNIRKL